MPTILAQGKNPYPQPLAPISDENSPALAALIPQMGRQKRVVVPGLAHHITQRGNNRQQVFDDDQDRRVFLKLLQRYTEKYEAVVWGYCLMDNHFHLVLIPSSEASLPKLMARLEADYARYVNLRRGNSGHLWQVRYYAIAMDEQYRWRALAYVERNPVRAGLVESAWDYEWSSAAARMGLSPLPYWLDISEWSQHWDGREWRGMLGDTIPDQDFGDVLREPTLGGRPLGAELTERLERERGIRLRPRPAGRPRSAAAA